MRSEVADRLASLAAAVDGVRECSGLGLASEELTELLRGVFREGNRLDAAFTSLVEALDRSEQERLHGQTVCQAWLAGELHLSDGAAYSRVRLARSLPSRPKTAAAFDAGAIGLSHAVTVTRTLDQVEAGGTEPELAESVLLEQAVECDPGQLRDVAKDLRHRLNPREVAAEEDAAHEFRFFDIRKRRDGSFEFTGHTGVEQGTRLRTAIEGVLGRKRKGDGRSPGQRRMDALDELARRALDSGELPARAGQKPHLLVSTTLETPAGRPGGRGGAAELEDPDQRRDGAPDRHGRRADPDAGRPAGQPPLAGPPPPNQHRQAVPCPDAPRPPLPLARLQPGGGPLPRPPPNPVVQGRGNQPERPGPVLPLPPHPVDRGPP